MVRGGIFVITGIFDKTRLATYVCTLDLFHLLRRLSMETAFLVVVSCACLVVGIYFFFVRERPTEKSEQQQ